MVKSQLDHNPHLNCKHTERTRVHSATERGMAQAINSKFICDGRYRIHWIEAVGQHKARVIEIEDVDSGQRFHGPASSLRRLEHNLLRSCAGVHNQLKAP